MGALLLAPGHAAELRQPLPSVQALVGVRVVTAPGEVLESATVVVRDGIIEAVGADVVVPPDAHVIEFERDEEQPPVTVYPGLIDPYLPLATDDEDEEGDGTETPRGRHPLIVPDFEPGAAHWPADRIVAHREAGFTTALIAPASGLLRGRSVLANLGDGGMAVNLLRNNVAQHAHLNESAPGGVYPQSLMGSVALFRQTLMDASWQARARAAWRRNPSQTRPLWMEGLDALAPALSGEQPLVFESEDVLDSLRILSLVGEDIDLVLLGHGAEYRRLNDFGRKPAHILPLDFPSAPDVKDEGDLDASLEELRHWKYAPENPARMIDAGFPVLFTAHGQSSPAELFAAIARAVEHGLDSDQALAALTTGPAEWLGISDRAGRIAPGYMANLALVEGDLLVEGPSITDVWVDGVRFELAKLTPPEVNPAGTWALKMSSAGMGEMEGEMVLSGDPTRMEGTMTVMGSPLAMQEARVSGRQLQIMMDASQLGAPGTISINLEIEGDRARGTSNGPFGEFRILGRRISKPDAGEVNR